MLIIPSRLTKNVHVPLPWTVGYHILGFLVLKGWQVDLHSETSPCMCWSVATGGCSNDCQVWRTLIASWIRTPIPRREWASREVSRIPQYSLSPTSSTISTTVLNVSATSLIIMSLNIISSSHFIIGHSCAMPKLELTLIGLKHPLIINQSGAWRQNSMGL